MPCHTFLYTHPCPYTQSLPPCTDTAQRSPQNGIRVLPRSVTTARRCSLHPRRRSRSPTWLIQTRNSPRTRRSTPIRLLTSRLLSTPRHTMNENLFSFPVHMNPREHEASLLADICTYLRLLASISVLPPSSGRAGGAPTLVSPLRRASARRCAFHGFPSVHSSCYLALVAPACTHHVRAPFHCVNIPLSLTDGITRTHGCILATSR